MFALIYRLAMLSCTVSMHLNVHICSVSVRSDGTRVQHSVYFGDLGINYSCTTYQWECKDILVYALC